MKKTLLLGTALVLGVAGYSQNARTKVAGLKTHKTVGYKIQQSNETATGSPSQVRKASSYNKTNAACNTLHVSSSYASAGIFDFSTASMSSNRNQLTYNKDLNTIVFTHRNSADWKTEAGGTKTALGSIHVTFWPAGNILAQDSLILYASSTNTLTTNQNSFRYPSGTIFNPAGNTDIKKSFMVATGAVLTGSDFVGVGYSVRQPAVPATYHADPAYDQKVCPIGKAPFGNVGGFVGTANDWGYLLNDMQQAGNMAVVAGPLNHATISSGLAVKGAVIGYAKHVGAIGTDSLVWSADSITPGFYLTSATAADPTKGDGFVGDMKPRIAYSPDGQIGYLVMFGRLALNYCNSADSMTAPIVYKSTSGGAWTPVLLGYDWSKAHPEVLKGVGLKVFTGGSTHFVFNNDNPDGADLAVDATGTLHFVCTVQEVSNDGQYKDSLAYSYSDSVHYDYNNHHPMIWDFMTDGNCWKTMLVDSINTSLVSGSSTDFTNQFSAWGIASPVSYEGMGAHIQVSRSIDGNQIFYGWAESDPQGQGWANSPTGLKYNVTPDLMMKGYDVVNHTMSDKKDLTNGSELAFQPFLSDISYYDAGQSAFVVPAFYVSQGRGTVSSSAPQGTIYDVNSGIDYKYTDCGTFTAAELAAHAATIHNDATGSCAVGGAGSLTACAVGIKINNAFESSISNYPNPFNGTTTIAVTLSENKAFNVNVYNAIGTLVYSKKVNGNVGENAVSFDGSALSSGVYYYTVTAGNQQATKKMIIQK